MANRVAEDARDDWTGLMHWIYIAAFAWIVALVVSPQATLAGTLLVYQFGWQMLERFLS